MHPVLAVLLLLATLGQAAWAATDTKQNELKELRSRIEQLQREIERAKEDRAEAADGLRQSERRISQVNRGLRELEQRQRALNTELHDIQGGIRQTHDEIAVQQLRLAELARALHAQGGNDALKLLLSGKDPAEISRNLEYYAYLGRARAEMINAHEAALSRLQNLESQAEQRSRKIRQVQSDQLGQRKELEQEKQAREKALRSLSARIAQQRKEVANLVRDEQRLTRLIERLARLAATPKPPPKARPGQKTSRVPDASLSGMAFPKLKGKLALPVAGEIGARFGQAREGGGPSWKGLFIRASEGQKVRAVGSGQVAFADWLRGFGNLLVIDHGGGYLSLYSNNESLYKQVGDAVRAGDVIASVGNTGGQPEHGLYFELRHQGKPFDPLSWVR